MEKSLFHSTPFFARFFQDSPVGIVVINIADGRYAEANPAFARMLGYSRDELIGQPFNIVGMDIEEARQMAVNLVKGNRDPGDVPLSLQTRDGQILTCITSVQLEYLEGEPYFLLIFQDLTDQEKAEERLRQSEGRFSLFFNSIPLPLLVFDEETWRVVDVNPVACALYGYDHNTFVGLTLGDLLPAADWKLIQSAAQPDIHPAINHQRLRDGRVIEVEVTSGTVTLDDRRLRLMIVQDVADQRAIEEELRAGRERFRILIEMATDTIWLRDLAKDSVRWSSSLKPRFGYDEARQTSHTWWSAHVHPDDREMVESRTKAKIESGAERWETEYRFRRADGFYVNVLDRVHTIRDESGHVTQLMGAMVDITEQLQAAELDRKAAQDERRRLARELHESVALTLNNISRTAKTVQRHAANENEPLPIEAIKQLGELSRHALRQLRLLVYELRPTQLEQAGLGVALRHRLEAVEQRAGIQFDLSEEFDETISPLLRIELFRLAQAMLNFLLKYSGTTRLSIRLWREEARLHLEIIGDGSVYLSSAEERDLATIAKRLEAINGSMVTEFDKGDAVRMQISVPLKFVPARKSEPSLIS